MIDVEQCKRIVRNYLEHIGTGKFITGTVVSVSPLKVQISQKLELTAEQLYITDSCIGLSFNGRVLRAPLKAGDGVLLLCRPRNSDGDRYILLDRIQPYRVSREVTP